MRVKWYGTATLLIEGGKTRILVDPYLKKYNKDLPRIPMEEAAAADAAIITHPHLDHFADVGAFLAAGLKSIYVSQNGIRSAQKNNIPTERMCPIAAGDRFYIGDIFVRVFSSRHCRFDSPTLLQKMLSPRSYRHFFRVMKIVHQARLFPVNGDVFALEFSYAEKRLVVLGSVGMDKRENYPQGADLMALAYQGRQDLPRAIQPILKAFSPKAVMATHFDDAFPPVSSKVDVSGFTGAVQEALPNARAFVPVEGVWYEV